MKYLIVDEGVPVELVRVTLTDKFGDPSLWDKESVFILEGSPSSKEWTSFGLAFMDSMDVGPDWTVIGPSVESLVEMATKQGARYLALDDGLVELAIEDEEEEVSVVPDIPEELPEVPVAPKRQRQRAPRKPDQIEVPEPEAKPVELPTSVADHLRAIILEVLDRADEDTLWDIANQLRK